METPIFKPMQNAKGLIVLTWTSGTAAPSESLAALHLLHPVLQLAGDAMCSCGIKVWQVKHLSNTEAIYGPWTTWTQLAERIHFHEHQKLKASSSMMETCGNPLSGGASPPVRHGSQCNLEASPSTVAVTADTATPSA